MALPNEIQMPLPSRKQEASPARIKIEEEEEEEEVDMDLELMDEETIDGSIRQQQQESTSTNNRITLSPSMALKTRFPPGCPVVYDDGESQPVPGHVTSVGLQVVMDDDAHGCLQSGQCIRLFYTIEAIPNNKNKNKTDDDTEESLHELVAPEDTLSYAIHCPVFVSLPNQEHANDDCCWLEGSIRMSYSTFLTTPEEEEVPTQVYYVDVTSNDGRKRKVNGTSENLRFRSNKNNKPNAIQKKEEKSLPVPIQIDQEVLPVQRVSFSCNSDNQILAPCSAGTISSAQSVGRSTLHSNSNNQDPQSSVSKSSTHPPQENSIHEDPQKSISTLTNNLHQDKFSTRQKRRAEKFGIIPVQNEKEVLHVPIVSNSCNSNNQVLASCSGTICSAQSVGTLKSNSNYQDPQRSISTSTTHLPQDKSSKSSTRRVSLESERKRKDPPENIDSLESRCQVSLAFTRNRQNNQECDTVNEAFSDEFTKKRRMPSIVALSVSQDGKGDGEMNEQTTKLRWISPREIQDTVEPPIPRKGTGDRRNETTIYRKGTYSAVVTFPRWVCPSQVKANVLGVNNSNQGFLEGLPWCNLTFTTGKETNINRRLRKGLPQIFIDNIDDPSKANDAVKQIEFEVVSKLDHKRQGRLLYELALLKTTRSRRRNKRRQVLQQYDTDLKTLVWMSIVTFKRKENGVIGFVIGKYGNFQKRVASKTNCKVEIYSEDLSSTDPYVFIVGSDERSVRSAVQMIETRIHEYSEGAGV